MQCTAKQFGSNCYVSKVNFNLEMLIKIILWQTETIMLIK